jgi:hypothetical protein
MSKRQLIEEIRSHNASAKATFLMQFDERQLDEYLSHLKQATTRNVRIGGWVRRRRDRRLAS